MNPSLHRSRWPLVLLALLFFVPFFSAYVARFWFPDWKPHDNRVNYGQLLQPTPTLAAFALRDATGALLANDPLRERWTLLQIAREGCEEACLRQLTLTRQLHLALGRESERVQRLLLVADNDRAAPLAAALAAQHPGLRVLRDARTPPLALAAFAQAPAHASLLIDPLGNWVLFYPPALDAAAVQRDFKGMQKDLKKLLKLSHIG